MGLTQKRHSSRRDEAPRRGGRHEADELDELIDYARSALTAPGSAPLAMQLDSALRVAGLHVRRSERPDATQRSDDIRWAVTLATFVAHRCDDTPPAAVIELASRAAAILETCAHHLPGIEAGPARELAHRARERVDRAEQLVALSLDDAISSLTIARALLAHAPATSATSATDEHDIVVGRAHSLLATAVVAARRAGNEELAEAALGLIPEAGPTTPSRSETPARRGLRRSTR